MKNFRQHKQLSQGFTTIPNSIFMDKRLSLKGVGMLCKLLSLPPNWEFSEVGLTKIMKDGKDSVKSALKELETFGYLQRERVRDENGKLRGSIYHVYEVPFEPIIKEDGTKTYVPEQVNGEYYDWMAEI